MELTAPGQTGTIRRNIIWIKYKESWKSRTSTRTRTEYMVGTVGAMVEAAATSAGIHIDIQDMLQYRQIIWAEIGRNPVSSPLAATTRMIPPEKELRDLPEGNLQLTIVHVEEQEKLQAHYVQESMRKAEQGMRRIITTLRKRLSKDLEEIDLPEATINRLYTQLRLTTSPKELDLWIIMKRKALDLGRKIKQMQKLISQQEEEMTKEESKIQDTPEVLQFATKGYPTCDEVKNALRRMFKGNGWNEIRRP